MVDSAIVDTIRHYLAILPEYGIHSRKGVLYGSFAKGQAHEWSDIDLLVIAPEFDAAPSIEMVQRLWRATVKSDNRIEPIACGEREWEVEDGRPILDIVRKEGVMINL